MNLDELTLGQIKELREMFGSQVSAPKIKSFVGEKCIIRTYSAGVWFGEVDEKQGKEVVLKNARRMHYWHAKQSISLSSVAVYGINQDKSNICVSVSQVWLEAIEIIPCTAESIASIEGAEDVQAK